MKKPSKARSTTGKRSKPLGWRIVETGEVFCRECRQSASHTLAASGRHGDRMHTAPIDGWLAEMEAPACTECGRALSELEHLDG